MSTYTKGEDSIVMARNRPFSVLMRWKSPAGVAINITGFTITATVSYNNATPVAVSTSITDGPGGVFYLLMNPDATVGVVEGRQNRLRIKIIDTLATVNDFDVPVRGVIPDFVA